MNRPLAVVVSMLSDKDLKPAPRSFSPVIESIPLINFLAILSPAAGGRQYGRQIRRLE
jgi:hypothetical protein